MLWKVTFNQYIENPLGKNNAVFSQRDMFRQLYESKFNAVFLREAGNIHYQLMYDKRRSRYYIHIKIPSEVVKHFYYDVVIMFHAKDPEVLSSSSLRNYDIKVFSNDPAFCFTYLRVFLKNDMFLDDLKPKAPSQALRKDPVERNPHQLIGYVKSLYFAFIFMNSKNLFNKFFYETNGIPYNKNDLLRNVEHADSKIRKRQEEGERIRRSERKQSKAARTTVSTDNINPAVHPNGLHISSTPVTKRAGKITGSTGNTVSRTKQSARSRITPGSRRKK